MVIAKLQFLKSKNQRNSQFKKDLVKQETSRKLSLKSKNEIKIEGILLLPLTPLRIM